MTINTRGRESGLEHPRQTIDKKYFWRLYIINNKKYSTNLKNIT